MTTNQTARIADDLRSDCKLRLRGIFMTCEPGNPQACLPCRAADLLTQQAPDLAPLTALVEEWEARAMVAGQSKLNTDAWDSCASQLAAAIATLQGRTP